MTARLDGRARQRLSVALTARLAAVQSELTGLLDAAAISATGDLYRFADLACDLAADGGDARGRVAVWQQVFTRVRRRDPLADTATGVALRFPLDADLAATLARLAAAEYRCCSFGSYTLVVDHRGLTLEVRMPDGAADMLAAVVGRPDPQEVNGA